MIRDPGARFLTGGSTGGWEALALQVYHPDFFGGTWVLYPDPVDFRNYEIPDIYSDTNAFVHQVAEWMTFDVPAEVEVNGQVRITVRMESQFEAVLGSRARSGEQFAIWEATYGPVGEDGYPAELWISPRGTSGATWPSISRRTTTTYGTTSSATGRRSAAQAARH